MMRQQKRLAPSRVSRTDMLQIIVKLAMVRDVRRRRLRTDRGETGGARPVTLELSVGSVVIHRNTDLIKTVSMNDHIDKSAGHIEISKKLL